MPLPRALARYYHLAAESGVRVMAIEPGGPAQQADLLTGDVIVGYDDQTVATIDDLQRLVTFEKVGVPTQLSVIRGNKKLDMLIAAEEAGRPAGPRPTPSSSRGVRARAARGTGTTVGD